MDVCPHFIRFRYYFSGSYIDNNFFVFVFAVIVLCSDSFMQSYVGKKITFCSNCLPRLMDIAKEMIREALPIKCLEAVILAMYL